MSGRRAITAAEAQRARNKQLRERLSEIPVAPVSAKPALEPCVACYYEPAFSEPCKSCIIESAAGRTYTKFQNRMLARLDIGVDPAKPGADKTVIRAVRTPVDSCGTCRHAETPVCDEPCKSCIDGAASAGAYSKFQPMPTHDDPLGQRGLAIGTPIDPVPVQFVAPTGYAALADVLTRALEQASAGKGAQRHAQGQAFELQPMQQLIKLYGVGFALGQAAKKAQEAQRLPTVERQVAELLGAINYLAGAVIALEGKP